VVFAVVHTSETAGQFTNAGQPATKAGKDGKAVPGRVETGGIFRSADGGETWQKVNDLVPRPFYYGQIRTDPTDEKFLYVLGVAFHASRDGGKTFSSAPLSIHPDHHALWVNPKDAGHLILGNDGGLYVSKDRGRTWEPKRGLVISQFYGVAADTRTPYRVYGGLQDNGSWGGPSATPYPDGITPADWRRLLPGDGFQAAADPTDPNTVYLESQYGNLTRVNLAGPKGPAFKNIRPQARKGETLNRFNWNAPILLSPHDAKTLYYGSQFLYKSASRGDRWERISPDLTDPAAAAPAAAFAHTILSLAESPVERGVLWVGTDDGKVWVSKDDGKEWADVGGKIPGVPKSRAAAKIECSHFSAGAAVVAIDRHRDDDFKPYLFITRDYGETWKPIAGNLPDGAVVGVVRQSQRNKSLLFAGTDVGLFVSFDAGASWHHYAAGGFPRGVRVDDLVIHPRDRDLIIATHGRGVWVVDVAPLEQLSPAVLASRAHLFDVKPVTLLTPQKRAGAPPPGWRAANPPARPVVSFLIGPEGADAVKITYRLPEGEVSDEFPRPGPGLHSRELSSDFPPGEYAVTLEAAGVKATKKLVVGRAGGKERKADE
ncbi:MAG TPA: hypothetical protein VM529_18560, partial [Gemmata sp.]|nr:hypothetical protein [Gemmata sp.]